MLKTVSGRGASPRLALLLRNEFAFLRRLDVPGVERAIALRGLDDAPTLVLESAGTEDLQHRLAEGPLPLADFFDMAIPLAEACERIHAHGIVHRAISPSHVVLEFEKLKVEVEERTRAEKAVRFLSDASALLAESLDYPTTLRSLARFIAPAFADWCIVDVTEDNGRVRRLAGFHADPAKQQLLHELEERHPPDWGSSQPAIRVMTSGKPLLLSELSESVMHDYSRDAENARLIRELGTRSAMAVPLVARGRMLGAITLGSADPKRPFGPSDLARP